MTHINAFISDAKEAIAAAQAAVYEAEDKLNALVTKAKGADPTPEELPKEPGVSGAASEGEAKSKTKEVKYK